MLRVGNSGGRAPFLDYELEGKEATKLRLMELLDGEESLNVYAYDVAKGWADYAAQVFEGEYAESDEPVWSGHCDQFGRIMLELTLLATRNERACQFYGTKFSDWVPKLEDATFLLDCGNSSEDRLFYRIWFGFLGHKDFVPLSPNATEGMTASYWAYFIHTCYYGLNGQLLKAK